MLGPLPEVAVTIIVELHRAGGMAALGAVTAANIVHFLLIYNQSWINKFPDKQILRGIIFSSVLCASSPLLANCQVSITLLNENEHHESRYLSSYVTWLYRAFLTPLEWKIQCFPIYNVYLKQVPVSEGKNCTNILTTSYISGSQWGPSPYWWWSISKILWRIIASTESSTQSKTNDPKKKH